MEDVFLSKKTIKFLDLYLYTALLLDRNIILKQHHVIGKWFLPLFQRLYWGGYRQIWFCPCQCQNILFLPRLLYHRAQCCIQNVSQGAMKDIMSHYVFRFNGNFQQFVQIYNSCGCIIKRNPAHLDVCIGRQTSRHPFEWASDRSVEMIK